MIRGQMVESRHLVAFAVLDTEGRVVMSGGDIEAPVYPRSAIKALQAIPLIETGAAEAWQVDEAEIALACASHQGEPRHVETVTAWLARIGCGATDLRCGAHAPSDPKAAADLLRAGGMPSVLHNNCSGKHAGFLTTAKHRGEDLSGYLELEHPVEQRVLGVLEAMSGLELSQAPRGIDGCGIPVIGVPLGNLALAMARLADPDDQPDRRQQACARIRRAIAAQPFMIGGSGNFDSIIIEATRGRGLVKFGAEGVHCAALPDLGLGIALKVIDGAGRASEVAMAALLCRLEVIDEALAERLHERLEPAVLNRAGRRVGRLRVAPSGPAGR